MSIQSTYVILDWDEHYENNRSRAIKDARWCPIPNRFDGDRISELIAEGGDGAYGAWCAALLVASRCNPRGVLLRSSGTPHTAETLSRITGITLGSYQTMLQIAEKLGLVALKSAKVTAASVGCHKSVTRLSQNGMEGMEGNPTPSPDGGRGGFDLFWDTYPACSRKVGRSQCKRLWDRGGLDSIAEKVVDSLGRWKASDQWGREGGRYIPKPLNWLTDESWESEPVADPAKARRANAEKWKSLGPDVHAELLAQVQKADPGVFHIQGNTDTDRAMRKLARERGLI